MAAAKASRTSAVPQLLRPLLLPLVLAIAVNIFYDHNGIVHQHADPQGQAGQGNQVNTDAGEKHKAKSGDDGDGDGQDNGQSAGQVAQKEKNHRHGQQGPNYTGQTQPFDGIQDIGPLVVDDFGFKTVRQGCLQVFQLLAQVFAHGDDVGTVLPVDVQHDPGLPLVTADGGIRLADKSDPGQLLQMHY